MKKLLFNTILPWLGYVVLHLWGWTLRLDHRNPEGEAYFQNLPGRYILTHWHSRILFLFFYFRGRKDFNILVSLSEDADLLANLGRLMGYTVVRGSTYKNAKAASMKMIRALKRDERVVIVTDGSRGPRHVAQVGSIQLARITGAPLIPMTYAASSRHEFNSWDRFVLPLPFSKCALNFGPPLHVDRNSTHDDIEKCRVDLEASLNRITEEAEASVHKP